MDASDRKPEPARDARSEAARQRKIGDTLKQLYEDVAKEPVPEDFLKLLEEADQNSSDNESD